MTSLLHDLKHAVRSLRNHPGFSAVAVVTLALGLGANASIFSVVDAYLLRPLPFPHADRLVAIYDSQPSYGLAPASFQEWRDLEQQGRMVEAVTAYFPMNVNYVGGDLPERLRLMLVAPRFFEITGLRPVAGRLFTAGEEREGGPPAVIATQSFWKTRLGGRTDAIGGMLELSDRSYTLVGVIPDPTFGPMVAAYAPLAPNAPWRDRGSHYLNLIGRLPAGLALPAARGEIAALTTRLAEERGTTHGFRAHPLRDEFVGDRRTPLLALLGAVCFVLLIATVNVANLVLVRTDGRSRELAVRLALGARRSQLIRALLTESLVLGLIGGAFGVLLGVWGTQLLVSGLPVNMPRPGRVTFDLRALVFTGVGALGAAFVVGLVPALLQLRRAPGAGAVLAGGRSMGGGERARRARSSLVVAELALSLVLLIGAGLMLQSFRQLLRVDTGFRPDGLLTLSANLPESRYPTDQRRLTLTDALMARIRLLPGVTGVAVANNLPLGGSMSGDVEVQGRTFDPADRPNAEKRIVSDAYFQVLGIPVRRGRLFTPADRAGSPMVVVVNDAMARRLWPGDDPIGRRIQSLTCGECWEEVIGVVGDVRESALQQVPPMEIYYPLRQVPLSGLDIVIRTERDPVTLVEPVRRAIAELDPAQPVFNVQTMRHVVAASVADRRLSTLLLSAFAALAVVLAAVGIGGVISSAVSQRTREIGLRIALGSSPTAVVGLVVRQGLRLALLGVVIGAPAALVLVRFLRAELYEVAPTNPIAFVTGAALLSLVALGACYLPARRAARVDPIEALRHE